MGKLLKVAPNRTAVWLAALLVVCLGVVCPDAAAALTPYGTLLRNTATITADNVTMDADDSDTVDTWVANWAEVSSDSSGLGVAVAPGDTVWIPLTLTNNAGTPDTFVIDVSSSTAWIVSIWDSGGASIGETVALAGPGSVSVLVAVCLQDTAGNIAESFVLAAHSVTVDSAAAVDTVSIYGSLPLAGFVIAAPATVYPGVAFGITVTAYTDTTGTNVKTDYDTDVTVTVDTGVVAPGLLATGAWVGGVWNGNITLTGCYDTVYFSVQDGAIAETVAIVVLDYWVNLDQAVYQGLDQPMLITVFDRAADTPAGTLNTIDVQVTSTSDANGITVTLTETGLATATFTGMVNFTQGVSSDGYIRVDSNGNAMVTYDPDGAGVRPAVQAQVSWLAIVMANLDEVRSWPNPWRPPDPPEVTIHRLPPDPGMVIEFYNVAAQRVRTLRVGDGIQYTPQENIARWNGTNQSGSMVASGTYIYLVRSSYGTVTRKMTLIR